jgi:multiple sugar transport system substrate-binding protein
MVEIEFSVMTDNEGDAEKLLPLLKAFEQQYNIRVNLVGIPWPKGWEEIAKFGIYGHGPDVSEVGSTWVGSLAAMQALRPLTRQEVRALGGAEAFFKNIWEIGYLPGDPEPWAVPWLSDVIVLQYWKDALEKAGIHDPQAAFATHAALVNTLQKLQAAGIEHPLSLTTINLPRNLHEAASWLWGAGGDLISPDYRQITFNSTTALQGLHDYFSLHPFISPASLRATSSTDAFLAGDAVVALGGPWQGTVARPEHPDWDQRLGMLPVPGVTYVGGGSLVIWKYSLREREAFEFVRFLASQPTRIPSSPHSSMLPTRRDALNIPSIDRDPFHPIYLKALESGRSFPTFRLWGSIEEKLNQAINSIWSELFANPSADIDALLHNRLDPIVYRLNLALNS